MASLVEICKGEVVREKLLVELSVLRFGSLFVDALYRVSVGERLSEVRGLKVFCRQVEGEGGLL